MRGTVKTEVIIIANGGANTASLQFALARQHVRSRVSADAAEIRSASHVILPGVGAAADAMRRLRQDGLHELIPTLTQPVLGICLGMQLLFDSSAEGDTACLGIIAGHAVRFAAAPERPVPHMGWNTLDIAHDSPLLVDLGPQAYAYFVHSYALPVGIATLASTVYGSVFAACVAQKNFYGTQFHPERSAGVGAQLLHNFLALH